MNALFLCPVNPPGAGMLGRSMPLALVPVLGRSLLDLALADFARRGGKTAKILAPDRPEVIRASVGRGEPWGLSVMVLPEKEELTVEAARLKYGPADTVITLDRIPQGADGLFATPASFFHELTRRLNPATAADRLAMQELAPGVFVNRRAKISPGSLLHAPCWVGPGAWISSGAVIGPQAVVETGACVDHGATVVESFVGPDTYVGAMTELRQSLAWGNGLWNWQRDSFTEITDDFLLADLRGHAAGAFRPSLAGRLLALLVMLLSLPLPLTAWWRHRKADEPQAFWVPRQVLRAPVATIGEFSPTCTTWALKGVRGLGKRWPELWNIVRGDFCWFGNRPLSREQALTLESDFERLWLATAPGLLSLADALDTEDEEFGQDARVHAAFYATCRGWRENLKILWCILLRHCRVDEASDPSPSP